MTNKKLLQIVAVFVVAACVFSSILFIGMRRIRRQQEAAAQTTLPPSTTAPTTTAPTTTLPSVTIDGNRVDAGNNADASDPTQSEPQTSTTAPTTAAAKVPSGKSEIIKAYIDAVNKLKNTSDFTLKKTEDLNVIIDEMTPSSLRTLANKIIAGNTNDTPEDYRFVGGFDAASGKSPNYVIAPIGKEATLRADDVASASAVPVAGGGYRIILTFGAQTQTLTKAAPGYADCMDVIKVESLGLPSAARVEEMEVTYDNSSIQATIDAQGRLVSMTHLIQVREATVSGAYVLSVSSLMHGDQTNEYQITYDERQ